MELTLESGEVIREAMEKDIRERIEGEDFAILSMDDVTYIQCAEQQESPFQYVLEYQDGSTERHYQASDEPITLDRVLDAFSKYLRGDQSWQTDFRWEKLSL